MESNLPTRGKPDELRSSKNLAKSIFAAELPEQYVRTIPAQSLYCVIQNNGLESSADLVEILTTEQCQLILDFDLWNNDRFHEERFWTWLTLTDATNELELLQKLFKCFDLKLVTILIGRYVHCVTYDEPTDMPPSEKYYTPDKGSTWIHVEGLNADKEFLLNRLLALIFETNADLFYQLIAIPGVTTESQLEEEAFQDREKRLSSEGIPDTELANIIHSAYEISDLEQDLKNTQSRNKIFDIRTIEPIIYDTKMDSKLAKLIQASGDMEQCESELSYLLNASIVKWNIDFSEYQETLKLGLKVKGAICLGIEVIESLGHHDLKSVYQALGLQKIFRLGLTRILKIRKSAYKLSNDTLQNIYENSPEDFNMIAFLREAFPCLPEDKTEELPITPISSLKQLNDIELLLWNY